MKRKCLICEFIGEDYTYFITNKKTCDLCISKKEEEREKKRKKSKENKKEYLKIYNSLKKVEKKVYNSTYYENNKDKIKKYTSDYYLKNREFNKINNKKRRSDYMKRRRSSDSLFKLKCNIRNLIKNGIMKQGYSKNSKTHEILGMSYIDFKFYIENKFSENMSWNNYGKWHLDHIIPISLAKSETEILQLNHYSNFQPLWAIDNIRKSNFL